MSRQRKPPTSQQPRRTGRAKTKVPERVLDKFSSFFLGGKGPNNFFRDVLGFWVLFSDSLAFSAPSPLFFCPKIPPGGDFGQN